MTKTLKRFFFHHRDCFLEYWEGLQNPLSCNIKIYMGFLKSLLNVVKSPESVKLLSQKFFGVLERLKKFWESRLKF